VSVLATAQSRATHLPYRYKFEACIYVVMGSSHAYKRKVAAIDCMRVSQIKTLNIY
jgi:hypothetical protein